jgi:hypothetical protein
MRSQGIKGHHKLPGKGYILEVALGLGSRDFRLSFHFVPTKHIAHLIAKRLPFS